MAALPRLPACQYKPVADNSEVISYIIKRAKAAGVVNVFLSARNLKFEGRAFIEELISAGAVAISDDRCRYER